ncbi:MAG: PrsW family glutamic-type intramembrane protease [Prolixibacteraceae bacterium]
MEIGLSIFPVIFFLIFLALLDSFKLVIKRYLFGAILWGFASAVSAYYVNTCILSFQQINLSALSRYLAPATEEIIKSSFIFLIIAKKRVGFMIDGAIYGFAVGTGFALFENIFYLNANHDPNVFLWIIRGFGTAIMHGGCTSLFSLIVINSKNRNKFNMAHLIMGFLVAYCIHSAFNHFYIDPIAQTIGIIILLPFVFILIFRYNEKQLQNWLEIEFNSEVELLTMINKGQFLRTRSGEYLASLKNKFPAEIIVDMYCFIRIYLELSIKAKRNVMLKENGFPIIIEKDLGEKINELAELREQIGKVGELTLSPLIRMNYRDLWKINSLK